MARPLLVPTALGFEEEEDPIRALMKRRGLGIEETMKRGQTPSPTDPAAVHASVAKITAQREANRVQQEQAASRVQQEQAARSAQHEAAWTGFKGFETLGSKNDRAMFNAIRFNPATGNYETEMPNWEGGSPTTSMIGMDAYQDLAAKLDSPGAYEGQGFGQFARMAGLSPTEAEAKFNAIISSMGGITNPGLRQYAPIDALISEYRSSLPTEAVDWWANSADRAKAVEWGEKYPSSGPSTFAKLMGPLSVMAPMFMGPLLAGLGLTAAPAAAMGAGLDAFGAAVPAGFAVSGGTVGATGAIAGAGAMGDYGFSQTANALPSDFGINLPSSPGSFGLGGQNIAMNFEQALQGLAQGGVTPGQFGSIAAGEWLPSMIAGSSLSTPNTFSNSITQDFSAREGYGNTSQDFSLEELVKRAYDMYGKIGFGGEGDRESPAPEAPVDDTGNYVEQNDAVFRSARNQRGQPMGSFTNFNLGAPGLYIP